MNSSTSPHLPRFVLFGDSLTAWSFNSSTQGFGWHLETLYKDNVEIENEGYPGYTSQLIKPMFSELIARITSPTAASSPTLLFTIFLGANDACFVGDAEYVPLPNFEANIREFVETILSRDELADANIVLITPPPINIPEPLPSDDGAWETGVAQAMKGDPRAQRGFKTYLSKKRYAEKIMEIAGAYEGTGRVVGLDYWRALVDAALGEQGRLGADDAGEEEKLPGCGLEGAKAFREGYFTDGLHLDALGYKVLSEALTELVWKKWPELSPVRVGGL